MKSFLLLFIGLSLLICPVPARGDSSNFVVLTPPDRSYIESEFLTVVLFLKNNEVDIIRMLVNGKEYPLISKNKGRFICKVVGLSKGSNKITIVRLESEKQVEEKELNVFFRSDPSDRYNTPTADFKKYSFHIPDNEKNCILCHRMGEGDSDRNAGNSEKSSCLVCHKRIIAYKFVHGPASVGSCTACHEANSKNKYDVDKPVGRSCYACHSDAMDSWNAMEYKHGPFSLGNCNICHSPHASDWPFWVRRRTTDLCISCHEDKASGVHVVSGFSGRGHPVKGKPDPMNPGRELSCASCHNPHASGFTNLLFTSEENMTDLCKSCHKF